ncbi:MAG: alpha/beta hydrolase [Pseudomonadota bacterium]
MNPRLTMLVVAITVLLAVRPSGAAAAEADAPAEPFSIPAPTRAYFVEGGDNARIAVQEWGNTEGRPIIFVHAFSQSHLAWIPQVTGKLAQDFRLITFDNRGHGNSDKPAGLAPYTDGALFAADLDAVIEGSNAKKPIVVAWSIGGVLTGDYVERFGDGALGGILYLGAAHKLSPDGQYFGRAFAELGPGMMSDDLATNVQATLAAGRAITAKPVDPALFAFVVATNMVVPSHVRAGFVSRNVDHFTDTLPSLSVPVRILHGAEDVLLQVESSREAARRVPNASLSVLKGVGHAPHAEQPDAVEAAIRRLIADSQ